MYPHVSDAVTGSSIIMLEYFFNTLPHFLWYFGASLLLAVAFLAIYVNITPHSEFKEISNGNNAAAAQLVGSFLGFAAPTAMVVAHSVSVPDLLLWGAVAVVVQLAVFFILTRVMFRAAEKTIANGCTSVGVLIGGISLGVGLLQAACMIP